MSRSPNLFEDAIKTLKREKMRITEPRKALLRLLVETERPLSAEVAHSALAPSTCDLVTVYRNLEAFESTRIADRIPTESGKSLYKLSKSRHRQHHVICRKCNHAESLEYSEITRLEAMANELGFTEVAPVLELYGICNNCR